MKVVCTECGAVETLTPGRPGCPCGGAWVAPERSNFDPALIDSGDNSVWRYRRLYGLDFDVPTVSLGAGGTPLVPVVMNGRRVLFKLDFLNPTGSFKDRGTELWINILARQGVSHVIHDSSGNFGASVAAYAAAAGMKAEIYVPAYASPAKVSQISIFGADVRLIPGPRANAKLAAREAAQRSGGRAYYGAHPGYLLGMHSAAWEIWEQLGRRAPDWYIAPVGGGSNLMGAWLGFRRLRGAGLADHLPRLVAVQAANVAPLCSAFKAGLDTVPTIEPIGSTLAEGVSLASLPRGRQVLLALRESGGTCVAVEEEAILPAQRDLARHGLFVEPTSAVAVAALDAILKEARTEETIVVSLTGSGLKGKPTLAP